MPLSKKAKTWIIILSIPIVLLAGAVVALKMYFTSEWLKQMIIPEIEKTTHRTVTVQDISFTIFPTLGVSIERLKISNPANASFDRDEFIALDQLRIAVKVLPLLSNRFEVKEILLDHPRIYLELTKDGLKNYSEKKSQEEAVKGDSFKIKVETKAGGEFLLSNFEIRDGEIEYIDKKFDSHMIITGLHQTASGTSLPGENALRLEMDASIEKFSYGSMTTMYLSDLPLTSHAQLTLHNRGVLTLDSVGLRLKELPLKMTGTVSELERVPMMDLVVISPQVEMSQVLSLVPAELLKSTKGLTSSGDVKFSMTIKGESSETMNPEIKGSFSISNGTVRYESLPKAITHLDVSGVFERPAAPIGQKGIGSFAIEKLSASLGNNPINGKLSLSNFDEPTLAANFAGSLNLNEVREFYPLEEGTELTGMLNANVSLQGKAKTPSSIKAEGTIEFLGVTMKTASSTNPLKDLNGTIVVNNQVVQSKQLAMNIGESDLNLSFVMKNYMGMLIKDAPAVGTPSASVTLTSKQLRTVDLMSEPMTASGERPTSKKSEQKNAGGLLPGFDIDASVTIGKLITEKFEFTNARGSVSISNGVITLKNFSVNGFDGSIVAKGTLDVRDPKKRPFDLDLGISGVQSNEMLPKFTSFGNNLFGKFTMNTKLKGDLNDTLGFNTQSLAGNGTVQVTDGKVQGLPLTSSLAAVTGPDELRVVNFKNWSNAFSISNGRLNINDLKINAGTTDFLVAGSQGLDGSLDYNLNVKLPGSVSDRLKLSGVADQLLQYFKDKDGRISLNFFVTGMTTSPVLKLDTRPQEEMARKAIEQKLDEGKKKLEDELKKKGEDALKKLFKRP